MSVVAGTAAAPRLRTWREALLAHPDAVALVGLALLAGLLVALTWGAWGALDNDTGHDFVVGARFAHGQLPYVDYSYYYGPLAPALLGAAAWLGGAGLAPFLGLGLTVAGAIVLATYALAREHAGPLGGFLAGALAAPIAFAPNQFSFVLPHTSAATLGILTLLALLLALGHHRPALAGVAVGLAALTKPEFALAAAVAAVGWIAVRRRRREALALALPALALPAAVYGAFLTAVPLHRLLFENLDPRGFLAAGGNTMLRARAPLTASSFAALGAKLALYALGTLLLIGVAAALRRPRLRTATEAALAGALLLAGAAAVRDPEALRHALRFAWGWIPAGAAVATVVLLLRLRRRRDTAAASTLAASLGLTVLAASTYAGFYAYAYRPQMAMYAVPLAAVFLARLHLVELGGAARIGALWLAALALAGVGLTLKDARAESAWVRGPGGALKETPALAAPYQAALTYVVELTRPGEPVLVAPQLSWVYGLAERPDPLPVVSLLPGALPGPRAERGAIAALERAGARVALIDRRSYPGYGHTRFGGSFDRGLDRWIRSGFIKVASFGAPDGPLEVWLRRGA